MFLLAAIILCAYMVIHISFGAGAHVLIHDNLDDNFVNYKILKDDGLLFSGRDTYVPNMLGGYQEKVLVQLLWGIRLLFLLFPAIVAYFANFVIMHIVAFAGMYVLCKRYIIPDGDELITIGTALAFSLLPFTTIYGLTVAAMPLVLYALLNIRGRRSRVVDWVMLGLVPFYSSFGQGFVFFICAVGAYFIVDLVISRSFNWRFLLGLIWLTVMFLVAHENLLRLTLFPDFVSTRTVYNLRTDSLKGVLYKAAADFINGHYHAPSLQKPFILASTLLAFIVMLKSKKTNILFVIFLALTAAFAAILGLHDWRLVDPISRKIPILNAFIWSRFNWMHPVTWMVLFGISLLVIKHGIAKSGRWLVLIFLCGQIGVSFYKADEVINRIHHEPSFEAFYAERLFSSIKGYIGLDPSAYRVASVGMHPAVAGYNGIHTVDGYMSYFPLSYKQSLRRVISKELEKDESLRRYFDDWGGRMYVFSTELRNRFPGNDDMVGKESRYEIGDLGFDTAAFKALGGKYLLSAVPIGNAKPLGLTFLKLFQDAQSYWDVYLYGAD
jgi:hypothetical protein